MWLVFVFLILILGIVFSKIEIIIKKIRINRNEYNFKVKIKFMFFGIIKLVSINLGKNGIELFGKELVYERILNSKKLNEIKYNIKKFDLKKINHFLKIINLKLSSAKFTLKIGADDIFITSFLVVILSSYITNFFKDKIDLMSPQKFNYRIFPEFNKSELIFEGNAVFKLNFKDLRKVWELKERV